MGPTARPCRESEQDEGDGLARLAPLARAPRRLEPRGDAPPPLVFHRGAHAPYATRWFGATSLAGHARNLVSSAIAAESIDSRDWMRPARPEELLHDCTRVLAAAVTPATPPATLVGALGRPVWIDFVADTGDDHDVSQAVARMIFETYSVEEDGRARILPRGDVLLFGGDTAYPVATGEEIARRVVAPWNEVLRERGEDGDGRRVLLGIAGNHDWYDGLDGFGRLFRRRPIDPKEESAGVLPARRPGVGGGAEESAAPASSPRRRRVKRRAGVAARQLHLDEVGGIVSMLASAWRAVRALVAGSKIVRPRRLALIGYDPVQEASYWALPSGPGARGVGRRPAARQARLSPAAVLRRAAQSHVAGHARPLRRARPGDRLRREERARGADARGVPAVVRGASPPLSERRRAPLRAAEPFRSESPRDRGRRRRVPARNADLPFAERSRSLRLAVCRGVATTGRAGSVQADGRDGGLPRAFRVRAARGGGALGERARNGPARRGRVPRLRVPRRRALRERRPQPGAPARRRGGGAPLRRGARPCPDGAAARAADDGAGHRLGHRRDRRSTRSWARSPSASFSPRSRPSGSSTSRRFASSATPGTSTSCVCACTPTAASRRGPSARTTRSAKGSRRSSIASTGSDAGSVRPSGHSCSSPRATAKIGDALAGDRVLFGQARPFTRRVRAAGRRTGSGSARPLYMRRACPNKTRSPALEGARVRGAANPRPRTPASPSRSRRASKCAHDGSNSTLGASERARGPSKCTFGSSQRAPRSSKFRAEGSPLCRDAPFSLHELRNLLGESTTGLTKLRSSHRDAPRAFCVQDEQSASVRLHLRGHSREREIGFCSGRPAACTGAARTRAPCGRQRRGPVS